MTILYKRIGYCKWESETSINKLHANKDATTVNIKDNSQQFLRNNNDEVSQQQRRRREEQVQNCHDENSKRDREINEFWNSRTPSTDFTLDLTYDIDTDDDESVGPYVAKEEELKKDLELREHNNDNTGLGPKLEIDEMEIEQSHANHHPSHNLQHTVTYDVNIGFQQMEQEEKEERGDDNGETDTDLDILDDDDDKRDEESDVSHLYGLDCVQPPPPTPTQSLSSETTEQIEYVFNLSQITEEPILYRRDRIKSEEIIPSPSSSELFTLHTTGIVRSVSSSDICNELNALGGSNIATTNGGVFTFNSPTSSDDDNDKSISDNKNETNNDYDDDVSTITTPSDICNNVEGTQGSSNVRTTTNDGWTVTRQILLQPTQQEEQEKRTTKWKWSKLWNNNKNKRKNKKKGTSSKTTQNKITSVKGGCICGGVDLNMIQ